MSIALLLVSLVLLHALGYVMARRIMSAKLKGAWFALAPFWSLFLADSKQVSRKSKAKLALWEALWTYCVIVAVILGVQSTAGVATGTFYHQVEAVAPGSPAEGVFEPGDVVMDVGGEDVAVFRNGEPMPSISSHLQSPGPIEVGVVRHGQYQKLTVSPRLAKGGSGYSIGIQLVSTPSERDVGFHPRRAVVLPLHLLKLKVDGLIEVVVGGGPEEFTGPVGLSTMYVHPTDWREEVSDALRFLAEVGMLLVVVCLLLAALMLVSRRPAQTGQIEVRHQGSSGI